jgi:hypothetical protein
MTKVAQKMLAAGNTLLLFTVDGKRMDWWVKLQQFKDSVNSYMYVFGTARSGFKKKDETTA